MTPMGARLAALLAVGCLPRGALDSEVSAPDPGPPSFLDLTRICDVASSAWTVEAQADAWSGGITSFWTDGQIEEVHPVRVIASSPEGDHDTLRAVIDVVLDWREVTPGSSTSFRCGQGAATRFVLLDLNGDPADCWTEGDPALLTGVPDCAP